jgi:hypothetical protein
MCSPVILGSRGLKVVLRVSVLCVERVRLSVVEEELVGADIEFMW